MTASEILTTVRQYILDNFLFRVSDEGLSDRESLIDTGIIDSMGILGLVTFLEEQFEILIPDADVRPENLGSIQKITTYICRCMGQELKFEYEIPQ